MAKPTIKFSGVRFTAGSTTGYRPQLEKADKVSDFALAEEICIERRLSLSPDELLYAVKATLETAPQLIMADGRIREFSNLLRWNRSATGRLGGAAGAWNETCRAYVRAQLLKGSKGDLDATFVNSESLPVPKLDNVTWIGAVGVVNCLKQYEPFAAYGRNMQFIGGDTAKIVHGTTEYNLTCTTSSVSQATFSWPAGLSVEPGTEVQFVMSSRGGMAEAGATTTTKKVAVLAGTPVIVQTSDHVGKVFAFKCGSSSTTFTTRSNWTATAENVFGTEGACTVTPAWFKHTDMPFRVVCGEHVDIPSVTFAADGKSFTVDASNTSLPPGEYANAALVFDLERNTHDIASETLEIPLAKVIVE